MSENPVSAQEIANREHIGPVKTGDNIAAKRVANYVYDEVTASWVRANGGLVPTGYDALTYTSASTTDTYKYYMGGTGGTLVATVTVTWTDATKTVLVSVVRT